MNRFPNDPKGFRSASVWFPLLREVLLFVVGVSLLVAEATHDDPRTPILLVGLAMVGIPVAGIFDRALGGKP